jgi:hypothetical protein
MFAGCESLEDVKGLQDVVEIGYNAFYKCTSLQQRMYFPKCTSMLGTTSFGACATFMDSAIESFDAPLLQGIYEGNSSASAFRNCLQMTSVNIPSVANIGAYTFYGCTALAEANFSSVANIGAQAFYNCTSLSFEELNLPNLTSLGQNAFYGVKIRRLNLGSLTAWPSFTNTSQNFGNKSVLEELIFSDEVTNIPQYFLSGYSKVAEVNLENVTTLAGNALRSSGLVRAVLPNLTTLGGSDFRESSNLEMVELGAGLTSSMSWTFYQCKKLATLIMRATTPPTADANTFSGTKLSSGVIYVPDASVDAYKAATNWSTYADRIYPLSVYEAGGLENVITFADPAVEAVCLANFDTDGNGVLMKSDAEAVTSIGDIFVGNTDITSFDELQYFTGIDVVGSFGWGKNHGFSGCTSLRSIVLPTSAKSLCNGCFSNTTSLTSLKGTENITTLGHSTFGNDTFMNSAITDVDFSNLQDIIGNDAFLGSSIKVVNFPKLKTLGMGAFKQSKVERVISLGEITSLDGTSDYARGMFYGCTLLESVALPETLHTIGALCFRNCSALKDCNIPESVTTIGAEAFYGASLDGKDIVLKNVQSLQASTFKQSKIRSIIMPNVITTTGTVDFAVGNFYQCTSLEYALFGKTLSSIGGGEFNNCSEMRAFVCLANVPPTMAAQCFNNTLIASGSGYIYVPDASVEAYKGATNWNTYADQIKGISQLATDNPTLYAEIEEYL